MIGIVVGSTRPVRIGDQIGSWLAGRGAIGSAHRPDLIDLAEVRLPLLDEPEHASTGQYAHDHTKAWSRRIAACDAIIFVTPEYNSSFPAPLKNAIDYLYDEWRGKPVAVVGYGGISSGGRAVQSLLPVLIHLQMRVTATMLVRFRQHLDDGHFLPDEALNTDADDLIARMRAAIPVRP